MKLDVNALSVCHKCTLRLTNVTDARLYAEYSIDELTTGGRAYVIPFIAIVVSGWRCIPGAVFSDNVAGGRIIAAV